MPPIPQRTRMFGRGRFRQHQPLGIGAEVTRTSKLQRVQVKNGSSGELAFVAVRSEFAQDGQVCVVEEQDFVYRSGAPSRGRPPAQAAAPAQPPAGWRRSLTLDEAILFRFSALTANAHRIHYDDAYATQVEGHPGLVVQGPLLVLAMAELARQRTDRPVESIEYRLKRPVYLGHDIDETGTLDGDTAEMTIDSPVATRHAVATIGFGT